MIRPILDHASSVTINVPRLLLTSIALAYAAPLLAQEPPASTSTTALAKAITIARPPFGEMLVQQWTEELSADLLHGTLPKRGPNCDPEVPECRAVAERIAHEFASHLVANSRAARIRGLAAVIDDRMTTDQVAAAIKFVGTPAGRALIEALTIDENPIEASPTLSKRLDNVTRIPEKVPTVGTLLERFYDETKQLPRAKTPVASPPASVAAPKRP